MLGDDNSNTDEASSSFSAAVVVTEAMITQASKTGDLESLGQWARQGVRVQTAEPLIAAVWSGFLEVVKLLVTELGADANKLDENGDTALETACWIGRLEIMRCMVELGGNVNQVSVLGDTLLIKAVSWRFGGVVRCLVEIGASVEAVDSNGNTALLESAEGGNHSDTQYLLEHAGANMEAVNNDGKTIWDLLTHRILTPHVLGNFSTHRYNPRKFIALLRVLVLRGSFSPALVALLPPEPARVVQEGARLRARLPAYLSQRRALLNAHCSVLLPPLRALVHGYMKLTTTEELWATGLGQAT
jgi:hypothetical protein